jgi:hypothetical protein
VAGVGHASPVRPDPSTLGVVGERGSRREGRSPARARQAPELGLLASGRSQVRILSWLLPDRFVNRAVILQHHPPAGCCLL